MTAEEFTDTVFSKIDVNGDGEAELGPPGRGHWGCHQSQKGRGQEGRGRLQGAAAGCLLRLSPPWPQSWLLGMSAPDFGVSGPWPALFTATSSGLGSVPHKTAALGPGLQT